MSLEIAFTIPTNPQPYERTGGSGKRRFTPPKTEAYMALVGMYAMEACALWHRAHRRQWPRDARYAVTLIGVRSDARRCDVDNIAKSVFDGCTGAAGLWLDDGRIDDLRVVRAPVDKKRPRMVVHVSVLDETVVAAGLLEDRALAVFDAMAQGARRRAA